MIQHIAKKDDNNRFEAKPIQKFQTWKWVFEKQKTNYKRRVCCATVVKKFT